MILNLFMECAIDFYVGDLEDYYGFISCFSPFYRHYCLLFHIFVA